MKTIYTLLLLVGSLGTFTFGAEGRWKVIDEGFQLTIPQDWQRQKVQPIDSHCGTYLSKRAQLDFDEVFGLGYTVERAQARIDELKKKETNPKLRKAHEEVWRVGGRLASFWSGTLREFDPDFDPKKDGKPRFANIATLFIPYEGKDGYLVIYIFYKSKRDLPTARRVLQSVRWNEPISTAGHGSGSSLTRRERSNG